MKYPIYFENIRGIRTKIGEAKTMYDVYEIVNKFLEKHNYISYYKILNDLGSEYQLDVGSHYEFFYFSTNINMFRM
jgi:hypothetical protein